MKNKKKKKRRRRTRSNKFSNIIRLPKPSEQEIQQDYWSAQAARARNSSRLLGCPSRPSKKFRKIIGLPKPSKQEIQKNQDSKEIA